MNRGARPEPPPPESSRAAEIFDHFCSAGTMKQILALHRELCNTLNMKPNRLPEFYPKLKSFLVSSWRAIALFKKFDARASHKIYGKARMCAQSRVLIIGAGPCGLRAAIECQLLGAKVVVVEKRDKLSRNNVLHLWPFVIHDLRALGAKKFFGKFCAGTINHISIRQLQLILLKVSLLLGVEFHEGVGFEELLEPTTTEKQETVGWRARVSPAEHPVSEYEFDTLIGADGKRNTLQGFNRKEFRGRLAMGITANFINKHTEREASVDEISGVAFIFNQKFFKELYEETGINLENIVYYKDDTHYFVMTAKKQSLLDKGVLRNDYADVNRFLSAENMDREALKRYAREAAQFSTKGGLTSYEFALNHYGEPDVALFDFSAMFAAGNASLVREKHNRRLLCLLVGDSLMEPFWPTGSGCARGFLSALDAAWCVRAWSRGVHPQVVIAERESVYRLLAQTTAENIQRDYGAFTLDPGSRYPNLNRNVVSPQHVEYLYISDDRQPLDMTQPSDGGSSNNSTRKRRRGEGQEVDLPESVLLSWVGGASCMSEAIDADCLGAAVRRYRPDLLPAGSEPQVYQVLQQQLGIQPLAATGSTDAKMRNYLSRVYNAFKGEIPYVHHDTSYVYDQIKQSLQKEKTVRHTHDHSPTNYKNAADLDKSHSSSRKKRRSVRTPQQEEGRLVGVGGREFGSGFRVARLAAELAGSAAPAAPKANKPKDLMRSVGKIERDDWHVKEIERKMIENRLGRPEPKSAERVPKWDRTQFLGRKSRITEGDQDKKHGEFYEKIHIIDQKLHDSGRPDHGTKKVASLANKFVTKGEPEPGPNKTPKKETQPKEDRKLWRSPPTSGTMCATCGKRVFAAESVLADGLHLHRTCFRCNVCRAALKPGNYTMERYGTRLVCLRHSGISVPDSVAAMDGAKETRTDAPTPTPERISLEASDSGAREIDEDEWTDRNCLPSETSAAGGLSDEDDSSSDEYTDADSSTDEAQQQSEGEPRAMRPALAHPPRHPSIESFGYDEYEEDGAESSGNESCSRMREAREARRREVPADKRPPTDSSEVETDESSDSSSEEDEMSSGTAVSTDSEFGREESAPPAPPAILVTEAPPPAPPPLPRVAPAPPADFPLSRTKSAGGLATKRALELKRKYLLGEPSPPSVRKSDSTSQLDTKLEAFRTNITEFQKMLHPAPQPPPTRPVVAFQLTTPTAKKPMPDIIKNLCEDAPVDLLTKVEPIIDDWVEETAKEKNDKEELDSDSLSESSHTETAPNQAVPRLEVHDEIGELIQLDSLMIVNSSSEDKDDRATNTATVSTEVTVIVAESESSESCRDVTTLALTETELSDWAAESGVLEDCALDDRQENSRSYNPRGLSGPKTVHDAKNISAITSHVCGRTSPDQIVYSNALEHFEFADEGEQDPSVEFPVITRNFGYMEFVEDEYDPYTVSNDRSMNFIERSFSEIIVLPNQDAEISLASNTDDRTIQNEDIMIKSTDSEPTVTLEPPNGVDLKSPQLLLNIENVNIETLSPEQSTPVIALDNGSFNLSNTDVKYDTTVSSPSLIDSDVSKCDGPKATPTQSNSTSEDSPPLAELSISKSFSNTPIAIPSPYKLYSPAICRSASENFNRSLSRSTESPTQSFDLSVSLNMSSGSISPTSPVQRDTTDKVQEIKRERDEQTETVRRLVLERIGSGPRVARKCSRRVRASPMSCVPPPVPPPPVMPDPPPPPPPPVEFPSPPPRPAPPLPVTPSFSDPELARERRRKSIIRSLSNYLNRRLGPRTKHEESGRSGRMSRLAHQSTGALERAPPVPPLPVSYRPPQCSGVSAGGASEAEDRDAMQLWFEARWARLVAQRRAREEPRVLRLASLQRRLARPLSAEQEAATVAELVQVSAQREAHQALMAADRRRAASGGVGD